MKAWLKQLRFKYGFYLYKDKYLMVKTNGFYRWLQFDDKNYQTAINLIGKSNPTLQYIVPFSLFITTAPGDVLLLGLGGGGICHYLRPYLNKNIMLGVERDHQVIHVAKKFFFIHQLNYVSIKHADAIDYVFQTHNKQWPYIIVDIYSAVEKEHPHYQLNFINRCYQMLQNQGVLSINIPEPHYQKQVFDIVKKIFNGNVVVMPISQNTSNIIIHAVKSKTQHALLKVIKNKPIPVKRMVWDAMWGYMVWV